TTSFTVPDFTQLFNTANLSANLAGLTEGWNGFFDTLEKALDNQVFLAHIPLIGNQLGAAVNFINDLQARVVDHLPAGVASAFVQAGLFHALGPAGPNGLRDTNNDHSITPQDIQSLADGVAIADPKTAILNPNTQSLQFNLQLHQDNALVNSPISFALGLPGL